MSRSDSCPWCWRAKIADAATGNAATVNSRQARCTGIAATIRNAITAGRHPKPGSVVVGGSTTTTTPKAASPTYLLWRHSCCSAHLQTSQGATAAEAHCRGKNIHASKSRTESTDSTSTRGGSQRYAARTAVDPSCSSSSRRTCARSSFQR